MIMLVTNLILCIDHKENDCLGLLTDYKLLT